MSHINIECKNLSFGYQKDETLKNINFRINEGESVGIIGENGAGKSTLSSVLSGNPAFTVTEGSVTFYGKDLLALPPEDSEVSRYSRHGANRKHLKGLKQALQPSARSADQARRFLEHVLHDPSAPACRYWSYKDSQH